MMITAIRSSMEIHKYFDCICFPLHVFNGSIVKESMVAMGNEIANGIHVQRWCS